MQLDLRQLTPLQALVQDFKCGTVLDRMNADCESGAKQDTIRNSLLTILKTISFFTLTGAWIC